MKTIEIENSNIEIALFMNYQHEGETLLTMLNGKPNIDLDILDYHTSWNWLMPVVERIESIGGQQVFINGCCCNIYGEKHETIKAYGNKIDATYKAVVEFVKWYNEKTNIDI